MAYFSCYINLKALTSVMISGSQHLIGVNIMLIETDDGKIIF